MASHTPEYLCYSKLLPYEGKSGQMVAILVKASIIKVSRSSSPPLAVFPPCLTAAFTLPLQVKSAETIRLGHSKPSKTFLATTTDSLVADTTLLLQCCCAGLLIF